MLAYAGIGSRETPPDIIQWMERFAKLAAELGWTLRSGAAKGADSAFERGCDLAQGKKEIFLPWRSFEHSQSSLYTPSEQAHKLAKEIHPIHHKLGPIGKLLIARNMHQILGESLDSPVRCVVCWTADACESFTTYNQHTGGTGSAISLASLTDIPVFNVKTWFRADDAIDFMQTFKEK